MEFYGYLSEEARVNLHRAAKALLLAEQLWADEMAFDSVLEKLTRLPLVAD